MMWKKYSILAVLFAFLVFSPAFSLDWWNSSWHYRYCVEINSSSYDRTDWPIEYFVNFTDVLHDLGITESFDNNSVRVVEQNGTTGEVLYEIPSQFDRIEDYNATANAAGYVVFIMNGTTPANTSRVFCFYFDTLTAPKPPPSYDLGLNYTLSGEEFNVNVTVEPPDKGLRFYIDTRRGENTSGLYRVVDFQGNDFWEVPSENERTITYHEYSNGTHNFTFYITDVKVVYGGPVRVVLELEGNETIWNTTTPTGIRVKERYIFYALNQWYVVEQKLKNGNSFSVVRNSTPAGALVIDIRRAQLDWVMQGSSNEPGSWWWFAAEFANFHVGVINWNHSGNFTAVERNATAGRGGIELNTTVIGANESIWEKAVLHFNSPQYIKGSPSATQVSSLRDRLMNPETRTFLIAEKWKVTLNASTDYTIYNRGENVTIQVNVTYDSGNLVKYVNATLEYNGGSENITLYDDGSHGDSAAGDHIFTAVYYLSNSSATGKWNVTAYGFDSDLNLLNTSKTSFEVYSTYLTWLNISNPRGFVNRTVNATFEVKNYRNDTYIAGAEVNCTWDGYSGANITDLGNGTYLISFKAPPTYGSYILNCTARKDGNFGSDAQTFTVVEYTTTVTVFTNFTQPTKIDKITLYSNQSFVVFVNVTNIGNGTAYDTNLTLSLPPGWYSNATFVNIGLMDIYDSRVFYFNITVSNGTVPGYYLINSTAEWKNADNTTGNYTYIFNVSVEENPLLEVPEEHLVTIATPGAWTYMGNITVRSIGNYRIENITFNVTNTGLMNFSFTPENISSLEPGEGQQVAVYVYVPTGHPRGIFNRTLNVSAENDGWDNVTLEVQLLETFMKIEAEPSSLTADKVGWYYYQNFTIKLNATNIGSSTAVATNITLHIPSEWGTNWTSNTFSCGDVSPGESCVQFVNLGIIKSPNATYLVEANVTWYNPGIGSNSNSTTITVTVLSHPEINVSETKIKGVAQHGKTTQFANFTLISTGNDNVAGLSYYVAGLDDFSFFFDPILTGMSAGDIYTIKINVTIPAGYPPGNYTGILNVTTSNANYVERNITVEVPESRSWFISPENCTGLLLTEYGKVCDVTVTNTGNVPINFTISPSAANYTYVNETNFTVPPQSSHIFSVWWNITGAARDYYNTTYNISAVQPAQPQFTFLNISLIPTKKPGIVASFSTNFTQQEFGNITISANVTDYSGKGIKIVKLVVSKPSGAVDERNMWYVSDDGRGNYTFWIYYADGDLNESGWYNFTIYAEDNVGITSLSSREIYVYPVVKVSIKTGFMLYFAGESGSIYVNVTDSAGKPLNATVGIKLFDVLGYLRFNHTAFTGGNGTVEPIPYFTLPTDAPLGNYTLVAEATYFDPVINQTLLGNKSITFGVEEYPQGNFETSISWYPDSVMLFYVFLSSQRRVIEPDSLELTVYDPAQHVFLHTTSGFTIINKTNETAIYLYKYAMPANVSAGYYLATLKIMKLDRSISYANSFRVSYGGPYDVIIETLSPEVPQGGVQNFSLTIVNMGDLSQDVFLDYWIEDMEGNVYAEVSGEAIFVPAGGNRTLIRTLPVYSDQPVGDYYLKVRLTYSPVKPPIEVGRSFKVVAPAPPAPAPPILPPAAAAVIDMEVTNTYPAELFISKGSIGYLTIEVKNTGTVELSEITAFFEGIPMEWFEIVRDIPVLPPGSTSYIVVKFFIPADAEAKTYVLKMRIIAKEIEKEEYYKITVFKTQYEALKARIENLKVEIDRLEERAGEIAAQGGDVSTALSLLRKAREMVAVAETYIEEDKMVDAIKVVSDVESTLEEVEYRLAIAKPTLIKVPRIRVPPHYYLIALTVILVAAILIFLVRKLLEYRSEERKKTLARISKLIQEKKEIKPVSDIEEMLRKQYEEGLISRETYEELRSLLK